MGVAATSRADEGFVHEALFYAGEEGFLSGTLPFVREGLERGESVLVVVSDRKIDRLREGLDGGGERVLFADMSEVGSNPAHIIPLWWDFVGERARGRPVRGIGEPISPERGPVELVECQRHESLLNLAFADAPAWRLLCPYDVAALDGSVVEEARRSHPHLVEDGRREESPTFRGLDAIDAPFDEPLPAPPASARELRFADESLPSVRGFVYEQAGEAGLTTPQTHDVALALNELATNTIRYGGGRGVVRAWREDETFVCEVEDSGCIDDPLVGRRRPGLEQRGGRGLWIANQLCDLVQVRSFAEGSTVRVHLRR
ncbi:MAG: anti-sigma factor RsbA family regulatory protein [Gaiellaceae bacterium]